MNEPLVRAHHVSKHFRRRGSADSLRDLVASVLTLHKTRRRGQSDFRAVDDISFEVRPGEAFGIIGPNGAGKSTLLKLLAGIMRPTEGVIDVRGRVSALIELGAGFHGDLTGRENIFLNASILGMSRREARLKFDEIVDFAGIGEFLDTPVKRYSSGMHARLGFAIAAHVCPNVLLVDEVLSVGDRVFRAKCMDCMNRFLKQGVAIVFVSHDLGSVARFCDRALVLERGRALTCGPAAQSITRYYDACAESLLIREQDGSALITVSNIRISGAGGETLTNASPGDRLVFEFDVQFDLNMPAPSYGLSIVRVDDHLAIYETSSSRLNQDARPAQRGDRHRVRYEFAMNVLPGEYAIGYHVREQDGLRYAAQDPYAVRVLVGCPDESGGVVHVAPTVEVQLLNKSTEKARRMSAVGVE